MAEKQISPAGPVVFTANDLRAGRVVWLGRAGTWVERPEQAEPFPPEEAGAGLAQAKAAERAQLVVGAYAVEVEPGSRQPVRFREKLRAAGPSVSPFATAA